MKNNKLTHIYASVLPIIFLFQSAIAGDQSAFPDINGTWVSLNAAGQATEGIFQIEQEGKFLAGTFTDSKDGKIIVESPLIGYIDKQGSVIFDLQFGRVTSTNRLKLSADQNTLDGAFTNTMGNEGEVHIRRK